MKRPLSAPEFIPTHSILGLLLFIGLPVHGQGQGPFEQWIPDGPPSRVEYQFRTTNGVTYFRLSGQLSGGYCCQRIAGYDVARQGSAFSQVIQQETWGGACVLMICDPWRQEVVSTLGTLPPGDYSLTLLATGPFGPFPTQWAHLPFTVSGERRPKLIVAKLPGLTSSSLMIQVTEVSNVTCVLEASTNLTDWIAVQTNSGPQVTFSVPSTDGPRRFYRATVQTP